VAETAICPHCGERGSFGTARPGDPVDCAACDRSFVLPAAGARAAEAPGAASRESAAVPRGASLLGDRSAHADAPLGRTGLVAVALTIAFYVAVVTPLEGSGFSALFADRGWVPYVISFLAIWSGVVMAWKFRHLRAQKRVFELDVLPVAIAERVTPASVPAFLSHLRGLPPDLLEGFLVQRVARTLEHFGTRANVGEAVDGLRAQAERDEAVVESSFSMLRVFIWAVPILGFIGTVLGIGQSVAGFSESVAAASDLSVMKDSIGTVTSGLGVAFDTTLLALVMSILIMFPTSSLQKVEEDHLARVDDYCQRHLVARLDGDGAGALEPTAERRLERIAEELATRLAGALERRGGPPAAGGGAPPDEA